MTAVIDHQAREVPAILVTEAHAIGSIAVIRSLGRAGYVVHACSSDSGALGFKSSFTNHSVQCPDYDDPAFLP